MNLRSLFFSGRIHDRCYKDDRTPASQCRVSLAEYQILLPWLMMVNLVKMCCRKTTTAAPPTAPYDAKFTHNPKLVANDIMIAFDVSSPNVEMVNRTIVEENYQRRFQYKTFAQDMIRELSFNPKSLDSTDIEDCGAGSRVTVVALSSVVCTLKSECITLLMAIGMEHQLRSLLDDFLYASRRKHCFDSSSWLRAI